ncbi:MAG: hypothetical protein ABW128_15460 [Rhizorhabdus sp.]
MPTIERQIDALGGAAEGSGEYNAGYHDGYSRALEGALEIAAQADELVEELIEWIDDALNGGKGMERWCREVAPMLARLKHNRSR